MPEEVVQLNEVIKDEINEQQEAKVRTWTGIRANIGMERGNQSAVELI